MEAEMKKLSFAAVLGIGTMLATSALATDCVKADCNGYSATLPENCDAYIKCPFDTSKKACIHYKDEWLDSCPAGKTCKEKYLVQKCRADYGEIRLGMLYLGQGIFAGNIGRDYEPGFMSPDGSLCETYNDSENYKKKLIEKKSSFRGIVAQTDGKTALILSFLEGNFVWGKEEDVSCLTNCTSKDWALSSCDTDGFKNFQCLASQPNMSDYMATVFCTSLSARFGENWFLPSAKELNSIGPNAHWTSGGEWTALLGDEIGDISISMSTDGYYWTSTEEDYSHATVVRAYDGNTTTWIKTMPRLTRCMTKYPQN